MILLDAFQMALTLNVLLRTEDDGAFKGGGTAFWREDGVTGEKTRDPR